jgi:diguanylate cyclase (GGDEF)-like protein
MRDIIVIDNNVLNHSKYNAIFSHPYKTTCYTIELVERDKCKVLKDYAILESVNRIVKANPLLVLLCVGADELKQSWYKVLHDLNFKIYDLPVVMLMPRDDASDDEELSFKLGATDYVPAPYRDSVFVERIRARIRDYTRFKEVESKTVTDTLTGCHNRRFFDAHLKKLWASAQRKQEYISILMIDIDKFKSYNDMHGHVQGDVAIKVVSETLRNSFRRNSDVIARYGGEEFVALLPDIDVTTAFELAEKARMTVEKADIQERTKGELVIHHLKVSIGAATIIPPVDKNVDANTLIRMADAALYKAKDTGRNRTCVFSEMDESEQIKILNILSQE